MLYEEVFSIGGREITGTEQIEYIHDVNIKLHPEDKTKIMFYLGKIIVIPGFYESPKDYKLKVQMFKWLAEKPKNTDDPDVMRRDNFLVRKIFTEMYDECNRKRDILGDDFMERLYKGKVYLDKINYQLDDGPDWSNIITSFVPYEFQDL